MKNVITILLMLFVVCVNAQTPFDIMSSHKGSASGRQVSSTQNPWIGAGLRYNLSGDVSQSFVLNARVLYNAYQGDRWGLPIQSNVGLNQPDSTNKESGVSFGAYPYFLLSEDSNIRLMMHGGLSYRFLDNADASLNEFRLLGGLEVAIYPKDGTPPITLSVAPEMILTNNVDSYDLSITGILPIANGLGLLVEGTVPFNNDVKNYFAFGIIANGMIK